MDDGLVSVDSTKKTIKPICEAREICTKVQNPPDLASSGRLNQIKLSHWAKVSYGVTYLQHIGESQIQKIKKGKDGILSRSSLMDVSNTRGQQKTDTR